MTTCDRPVHNHLVLEQPLGCLLLYTISVSNGGALVWNHERSAELWLGHRNEANRVFVESPILQVESTRHYAKLPSGHPMGYMDAVLNLFSDFYKAIDLEARGQIPRPQMP